MSNSDPTLFERLAKVEPAKLARLLVELAAQDQTILEQVQLLLASGDTTAIAKAVRSTLRAWNAPHGSSTTKKPSLSANNSIACWTAWRTGFLVQIPR